MPGKESRNSHERRNDAGANRRAVSEEEMVLFAKDFAALQKEGFSEGEAKYLIRKAGPGNVIPAMEWLRKTVTILADELAESTKEDGDKRLVSAEELRKQAEDALRLILSGFFRRDNDKLGAPMNWARTSLAFWALDIEPPEIRNGEGNKGFEILSWNLMRKTKGGFWTGPTFHDDLKPYNGDVVNVVGYMVPENQFRNVTQFLFLHYVLLLPFCLYSKRTKLLE